ncbi:MAG: DUF1476 domain-containing protein [Alphaproteobacteria bacterium]|nr:DUF1476 domain-containing protein [Alphaproteobacteria bacterium]TAD88942.1 MAG: DUF1476 domain-containing protein [Alphaproteobacteria bacterium]
MQFSDKERAEEAKWQLDQETMFRIRSRRNRLLGLWAAERMGHRGVEAESYARAVVESDLEQPGDEDIVTKVAADLAEVGQGDAALVRAQLAPLAEQARREVLEL